MTARKRPNTPGGTERELKELKQRISEAEDQILDFRDQIMRLVGDEDMLAMNMLGFIVPLRAKYFLARRRLAKLRDRMDRYQEEPL